MSSELNWVKATTLDDLWEGDFIDVEVEGEVVIILHRVGGLNGDGCVKQSFGLGHKVAHIGDGWIKRLHDELNFAVLGRGRATLRQCRDGGGNI